MARNFLFFLFTALSFSSISVHSKAATNPYDDPKCARLSLTSKTKADACYKKALKETQEILEEHREGIEVSTTIPESVKREALKKYESSIKAINAACTNAECRNNEMRELDKLLYEMTKQYTGTGTPYH